MNPNFSSDIRCFSPQDNISKIVVDLNEFELKCNVKGKNILLLLLINFFENKI